MSNVETRPCIRPRIQGGKNAKKKRKNRSSTLEVGFVEEKTGQAKTT